MTGLRKAAFLDRDGVINRDRGYVYRVQDFEFLPGALQGLKALQAQGYALAVITNQSGIARGLYSEADYLRLGMHLQAELAQQGIALAGSAHCPHLPDAPLPEWRSHCDCRKPAPGMLLRLAERLRLDLPASILVGDKASDIQAGRAAGVGRCFLVRSGHALSEADIAQADAVYPDLAACAAALSGII